MAQDAKPAVLSIALMFAASAMFACVTGLTKIAGSANAPMLWFTAAAMIGSGAVLAWISHISGRAKVILRRDVLIYSAVSGGFMVAYNAINFVSVAHVGASVVSLAFILPTLLTYLFAVLLRMDRLVPVKLLAVACGVAGGVVLARAKLGTTSGADAGWVVLAICNPVLMAVNNIYRTRFWPGGMGPLLASALMLVLGGLLCLPVAARLDDSATGLMSSDALPILAAVTVLFTLQYPALLSVQYLSGPVFLSLSGPLIGVFGATGAFLFLGEAAPPGLLFSAILMIGGVLIFQSALRRDHQHGA